MGTRVQLPESRATKGMAIAIFRSRRAAMGSPVEVAEVILLPRGKSPDQRVPVVGYLQASDRRASEPRVRPGRLEPRGVGCQLTSPPEPLAPVPAAGEVPEAVPR